MVTQIDRLKKILNFRSKFLISKKDFLTFNEIRLAASKLDYIILLYDDFFDKEMK